MTGPLFDIVIPTVGRPSLSRLLESLFTSKGRPPNCLILVDDRADPVGDLTLDGPMPWPVQILAGPGRGPASARNAGWRASTAEWVAFLDDDVEVETDWLTNLESDLVAAGDDVGGTQGDIRVPLPEHRPPTDWERNVAGLETALWATADMAYRRELLAKMGGFEEQFRRAYREDADMALRVAGSGYRLVRGRRTVSHPPGPERFWTSVRLQAGNADDVLMRALHGRRWRESAGAPRGRLRKHALTSLAAITFLGGVVTKRKAPAALGAAGWLLGTGELALARIKPGPRTPSEIFKMIITSALLPPAAVGHAARGLMRYRTAGAGKPAAVLFDRDGTLVHDEPYNGDPERVLPKHGAREALDRLRRAGVPLAVISNQSGIARGYLTLEQVRDVGQRVEQVLGPVEYWAVCPHLPEDGCECRKPKPGLIQQAVELMNVRADQCVMIGDIGSDVDAATAAGARAILVPTPVTRAEEVERAAAVAPDLSSAVDMLLGGRR